MFPYGRLLAIAVLVATFVDAADVAPSFEDIAVSVKATVDLNSTLTDSESIRNTVYAVQQKTGPPADAPPGLPVAKTVITALDGSLTRVVPRRLTDADTIETTIYAVDQKTGAPVDAAPGLPVADTAITAIDGTILKRAESDYVEVFSGSLLADDRDGSIEGTAYLTYTVVPNNTYSIGPCLDFCDRVQGCVFANLYYEYNNPLLDWVFSEKSNLKCVLYADVHTAAEKTNRGGQQQKPLPEGLTYIQRSSGYAKKTLVDPKTPEGYELVFGAIDGANNAPGYMGFAFLDRYDVDACAAVCNSRGVDGNGGACQYFNIWRALVNGIPTTYTCSMYYLPTNASTAVNYGQGDLKVTYSRGYRRKSLVLDSEFESYTCAHSGSYCYTARISNWITSNPATGAWWTTAIFHYSPFAHFGSSAAILGSASLIDHRPSTLKPARALSTTPGKAYLIQFFHQSSYIPLFRSSPKDAFVDVIWNGVVVSTIRPGYTSWKYYEFPVVAVGNDTLSFRGGKFPTYDFIDSVFVFLK